jgi:tetratricopeptide (TPR) repeat protein
MKLKTIKTLAIIQAVLLSSYAPLALAATSKQSPEIAKLDNIEEVIYGAPKSKLALDSRLKDLELKLFGITRKGTTTERLAAIEKTLAYGSGAATSGSLLPPLAPTLDTPATSSSAPSTASSNSSSSYDSEEPYAVDSSGALADAMQLYQDGKVAQAESAFHGIIAKDPNNGDAYYNLAVIAEGKNDLNGALSYYRSALNLNPQDTDLQSAVVSVQNKLAQSNTSAPSHVASSYASSSNPFAASSSSSSSSSAPRPVAPAQSKALDEARKNQLKSAVASASNDYKAGNYDSAVTKLNSVASQVPDDGDVQFALAQAYRAKGDLANARSHMARASSLNPASTSFGSALADIDRAIAAKNTAPADSFASSNQSNSGTQTASQPEGQITPFAGSKAASLDSQGGLSGMAYSARSNSSRLKRAATYGLAGAAAGALSGALFSSANNGSRMSSAKSNALRGAVLGAVFGFASGK